jgi:hypothetical protein
MAINKVFLASPQGDEIREVEATTESLSPLMSQGWHQVPAPTVTAQPGIIRDSEERGLSGIRDKPLMVAGWHQVPAPAAPTAETTETKEAK